jgi:hypothetical protein
VRWRIWTLLSASQFTFVAGLPFTKTEYVSDHHCVSSVDAVQLNETCDGPSTLPESTGDVGGVVSVGVVTVTVLLFADRFPDESNA